MSLTVFAAPVAVVPPPVKVGGQTEYTMLWTGVDGITWDMYSWTSGVYMASGLQGLDHAQPERWTQDSPGVPGSMFGGARPLAKPVQWPIVITTRTSTDSSWRDLCRRWWKGWSYTKPGTWTVTDSSGHSKRLLLRHNPSGDFSLDIDPGLQPWVPWTVDAIADFPLWRGDPIMRSFSAPKQYYFHGGAEVGTPGAVFAGPPYRVSQSSNMDSASIPNPGDVAANALLTIIGPFTSWSVTVGDGTVAGPAVADGDVWQVSTNPNYPIAIQNGATDVTKQLTTWEPRPVPPSDLDEDGNLVEVPITIAAAGTGSIEVQIEPLYKMGF